MEEKEQQRKGSFPDILLKKELQYMVTNNTYLVLALLCTVSTELFVRTYIE
jgi:hypothetical protein